MFGNYQAGFPTMTFFNLFHHLKYMQVDVTFCPQLPKVFFLVEEFHLKGEG